MPLITEPNLADPDAAYRLIVEAHRGLTDEQGAALDAALVLILANHIGDAAVLRDAHRVGAAGMPRRRHLTGDSSI